MNLATMDLDGGVGNAVLTLYIIGGVVLFATSFFPGNSTGWRVFSGVAGFGIVVWTAYVWLFGGYIIISYYVAVLPFILAFRAISAMLKRRKEQAAQPANPYAAPYQPAQDPVQPQ